MYKIPSKQDSLSWGVGGGGGDKSKLVTGF